MLDFSHISDEQILDNDHNLFIFMGCFPHQTAEAVKDRNLKVKIHLVKMRLVPCNLFNFTHDEIKELLTEAPMYISNIDNITYDMVEVAFKKSIKVVSCDNIPREFIDRVLKETDDLTFSKVFECGLLLSPSLDQSKRYLDVYKQYNKNLKIFRRLLISDINKIELINYHLPLCIYYGNIVTDYEIFIKCLEEDISLVPDIAESFLFNSKSLLSKDMISLKLGEFIKKNYDRHYEVLSIDFYNNDELFELSKKGMISPSVYRSLNHDLIAKIVYHDFSIYKYVEDTLKYNDYPDLFEAMVKHDPLMTIFNKHIPEELRLKYITEEFISSTIERRDLSDEEINVLYSITKNEETKVFMRMKFTNCF